MRGGRGRSRCARRGRDDGRWLVRAPTLKKHSPKAKNQDIAHRTSYSAVARRQIIAHRGSSARILMQVAAIKSHSILSLATPRAFLRRFPVLQLPQRHQHCSTMRAHPCHRQDSGGLALRTISHRADSKPTATSGIDLPSIVVWRTRQHCLSPFHQLLTLVRQTVRSSFADDTPQRRRQLGEVAVAGCTLSDGSGGLSEQTSP